ncbi:peptidoglycan DD-metalloendopeptidase family protein [Geodermatophilus sp. SYSU D00815]
MATPQYPHRPAPNTEKRRSRTQQSGVVAVAVSLAVLLSGGPAQAAPADDARAAAAEVARLTTLVAAAETELQRLTVEAEAASDASLQAQAALTEAQAAAEAAAAELAAASADVTETRDDVAELGRRSYMGDSALGSAAAFLGEGGPGEVLQRAVTLDLLSDERAATLARYEAVEDRQEQADRAAREAVAQRDAVARDAASAEQEALGRLAEAQRSYDEAQAEKAAHEADLREAEIALLAATGSRDPDAAYQQQQEAEAEQAEAAAQSVAAAAAGGGAVPPTVGRVTSCYGARWGSMHYGVDIAAPIGTPVYAPEGGTVLHAGAANGFGQAVYVQHGDGSITLYGHVNRFFVSAGQVVSAGTQIAEVGNKGQSTGPHLHFEVHNGGLYADRQNPVPWLTARGISLGGC